MPKLAGLPIAIAPKFVLAGRIVTVNAASDVHQDGCVCIDGDKIAQVCKTRGDLTPDFLSAPLIETGGTIFPGVIEVDNHLPYNYLPLWDVPSKYTDRKTWGLNEPKKNPAIAWPARILSGNPDLDYPRAIARFSECRSLLGGVTTGEGITVSSAAGAINYYQGKCGSPGRRYLAHRARAYTRFHPNGNRRHAVAGPSDPPTLFLSPERRHGRGLPAALHGLGHAGYLGHQWQSRCYSLHGSAAFRFRPHDDCGGHCLVAAQQLSALWQDNRGRCRETSWRAHCAGRGLVPQR